MHVSVKMIDYLHTEDKVSKIVGKTILSVASKRGDQNHRTKQTDRVESGAPNNTICDDIIELILVPLAGKDAFLTASFCISYPFLRR